jgi:hypothetical protein
LIDELDQLSKVYKIKCDPTDKDQIKKFFANYNPRTAMAFWLGGMPEDLFRYKTSTYVENPKSRLIGFSADQEHPLSDNSTSSRIGPFFEFDTEKLNDPNAASAALTALSTDPTIFRNYYGHASVPLPYWYYRAEIGQHDAKEIGTEYCWPITPLTNPVEWAVKPYPMHSKEELILIAPKTEWPKPKPYFDSREQGWVNPNSFQILFCGFDKTFGRGNLFNTGRLPNPLPEPMNPLSDPNYRYFEYNNPKGVLDPNNSDDQTNFIKGTIGNEIP